MTEKKEYFDENSGLRVSDRLSADLKVLFEPDLSVPPEVDRAVLDGAYRRLVRRQPRRVIRWAAWASAAAAVIIFVFMLDIIKETSLDRAKESGGKVARETSLAVSSVDSVKSQADIDQNGLVDILDAFKLARHIETALPSTGLEMRWDINGDGLVNRDDVDAVAFTAVRLDKGV